jgi:hypothetical protein
MPKFLKGNYKLSSSDDETTNELDNDKQSAVDGGENLTVQLEEKAMALLGGSMSFVMKGKTFIWSGEEDEDN